MSRKAEKGKKSMTNEYSITTPVSWSQTNRELADAFSKWGVTEWDTNYPKGARFDSMREQTEEERTVTLTYKKSGQTINLSMGKQRRAMDNLRVLYLAIDSMRLNEKRGIGDVIESAYLQLAAPRQEKSPWEILGIYPESSIIIAEAAYKVAAKKAHPDNGGSQEQMAEVNKAIEVIRRGEK